MRTRWQLTALLILVVGAGCASGAGADGVEEVPARFVGDATETAPRWERVTSYAGIGDHRTAEFEIAPHAIQWRLTATCTAGYLRVHLRGEQTPLVEPTCPGRGFGFSIRTGLGALEITASDRWEAIVEQQVDRPISEPKLVGMREAARLARGRFYGIDQRGVGTATLYLLPDGRRALRFERFRVTANSDLFVWISEARAPRTSEDAFRSAHVQVDRLKATAGSQNYLLPDSLQPERIRSVVVWCEPVLTAYAAATLARR